MQFTVPPMQTRHARGAEPTAQAPLNIERDYVLKISSRAAELAGRLLWPIGCYHLFPLRLEVSDIMQNNKSHSYAVYQPMICEISNFTQAGGEKHKIYPVASVANKLVIPRSLLHCGSSKMLRIMFYGIN
jgi:hypothetical protein